MRDRHLAFVSPTAAAARQSGLGVAHRLPGARLVPVSLGRYARDPRAPLRIVLCPAGGSLDDDLRFLREARRAILWPPPAAEVWNAIAGLRGSHDSPPERAAAAPERSGLRSALLLEGDVTLDRARRAASSGAPRDWIVERVQRVRIASNGLEELRRLGIRWATLEPVEVIALVASPALESARSRWRSLLPRDIPVWRLARGSKFQVSSSK
ncbi:MAG TPA: hypothetical protein VGS98_12685 [Thermoanaerobaculia bacterium]|nr:hypothetical protein [Thermoanaerobaculia bacterium]